jgi:hypothetical protein
MWEVSYNNMRASLSEKIVAMTEFSGNLYIATEETVYKVCGDEVRPLKFMKGDEIEMEGEE